MHIIRKIWLIPLFSAIIFFVFVFGMGVVFLMSQSATTQMGNISVQFLPVTKDIAMIRIGLHELQDVFKQAALGYEESAFDDAVKIADEINNGIQRLKNVDIGFLSTQKLDELFADYYTSSSRLAKLMMDKKMSDLSQEIGEASFLRKHLEEHLSQLEKEVETKFGQLFHTIQTDLGQVTWTILALLCVLTAVLGGGSYIVVRSLSNKLSVVRDFAKEVQGGNYEYNLKESWNDEFSTIVQALNSMAQSIKQSTEELNHLAKVDGLTGVNNRIALDQRIIAELQSVKRHDYPVSLCLCDIDNFKLVNDTHGHQVGDKVLVAFANCLKEGLRAEDVIGRYGGDEFCVLLPYSNAMVAEVALDRIRKSMTNRVFYGTGGEQFSVTGSFGVAQFDSSMTFKQLFKNADEALYKSKHAGRNCVSVYEEEHDPQEQESKAG